MGDKESVGSNTYFREMGHLQKKMLEWFSLSPPLHPSPQRGGDWRRLRVRNAHLRGKVFCVLAQGGDVYKIGVSREMCFACLVVGMHVV